MEYLKIVRLLVYFTQFIVCSGDIKKSSENNQLTGYFQNCFSVPPPLKNLKKKIPLINL